MADRGHAGAGASATAGGSTPLDIARSVATNPEAWAALAALAVYLLPRTPWVAPVATHALAVVFIALTVFRVDLVRLSLGVPSSTRHRLAVTALLTLVYGLAFLGSLHAPNWVAGLDRLDPIDVPVALATATVLAGLLYTQRTVGHGIRMSWLEPGERDRYDHYLDGWARRDPGFYRKEVVSLWGLARESSVEFRRREYLVMRTGPALAGYLLLVLVQAALNVSDPSTVVLASALLGLLVLQEAQAAGPAREESHDGGDPVTDLMTSGLARTFMAFNRLLAGLVLVAVLAGFLAAVPAILDWSYPLWVYPFYTPGLHNPLATATAFGFVALAALSMAAYQLVDLRLDAAGGTVSTRGWLLATLLAPALLLTLVLRVPISLDCGTPSLATLANHRVWVLEAPYPCSVPVLGSIAPNLLVALLGVLALAGGLAVAWRRTGWRARRVPTARLLVGLPLFAGYLAWVTDLAPLGVSLLLALVGFLMPVAVLVERDWRTRDTPGAPPAAVPVGLAALGVMLVPAAAALGLRWTALLLAYFLGMAVIEGIDHPVADRVRWVLYGRKEQQPPDPGGDRDPPGPPL